MRIRLITTVRKPFKIVYKGYDHELLKFMLPSPFARITRYEGQNPGDIIEICFKIPFMKNWTAIIKESWLSHREYGFIDRGLRVPLGISYWKHTHRVVARDNNSVFIIDDIEYETSSKIWDKILYIPLFLMFYRRMFLYKKYFRRHSP